MATAVIIDDYSKRVTLPKAVNYVVPHIKNDLPVTTVKQVLPFRVRFTTVTIDGYSRSNPPGIGLQVIGFSNWII